MSFAHLSRIHPSLRSARPLAALSADALAGQRWKPGEAGPLHSEVFASGVEGSGAALALALACDGMVQQSAKDNPLAASDDTRAILWVQDAASIRLSGRPYRAGLPASLRHRVIHVATKTAEDTLFALEEGVRCRDLAFVIGEIAGNPRALDFTASRRLSLAAEKHGVALWLVRLDAKPDLSSARMRWNARSHPSLVSRWDSRAPGQPQWQAELFRARSYPPGQWTLRHEDKRLVADRPDIAQDETEQHTAPAYPGHLARPTVGRSLAAL